MTVVDRPSRGRAVAHRVTWLVEPNADPAPTVDPDHQDRAGNEDAVEPEMLAWSWLSGAHRFDRAIYPIEALKSGAGRSRSRRHFLALGILSNRRECYYHRMEAHRYAPRVA